MSNTNLTSDMGLSGVSGGGSQSFKDMNAGFAFFLDCVVNLFVLAGILQFAFGFPEEVLFGKIIPGCIMGILIGNIANFWYTRRRVRLIGNEALTSIPMGVDLPTILGMCFFILGPVFLDNKEALGDIGAATKAWHVGMAATLWMGFIKFGLSFFGRAMQRELPIMALVGTMAGIATVWLGANAVLGTFALPEVGMLSLGVMGFALIAGHTLPLNMPGAVIAIILGTIVYYILALTGAGNGYELITAPAVSPELPTLSLAGLPLMLTNEVTGMLGIIFPFALLIAASAVNVVAGAKIIGDDFDPRHVVQIDSGSTLVMALFGGVAQTTPYFGHTTYKRMGARTNYALGTALVITILGFTGLIAFASKMIPTSALSPILIVVAADIIRLAFTGGDVRHAPALLFAIIPGILYYAKVKVDELYGAISGVITDSGDKIQAVIGESWLNGYALLNTLSSGYILASLIWGTLIVWIIDRQLIKAAGAAFTAALLTYFGVIHSVLGTNGMYLPWTLSASDGPIHLVTQFTTGYAIIGLLMLVFHFAIKEEDKPS